MKALIGIEEKLCTVRCEVVYGGVYVISVRDCKDGTDVRGYLDQRVLDQLAKDWLLEEEWAIREKRVRFLDV
jgi:hypothetical protein